MLASSGSEAVEIALKTALLHTGLGRCAGIRGGISRPHDGIPRNDPPQSFPRPIPRAIIPGRCIRSFPGPARVDGPAGHSEASPPRSGHWLRARRTETPSGLYWSSLSRVEPACGSPSRVLRRAQRSGAETLRGCDRRRDLHGARPMRRAAGVSKARARRRSRVSREGPRGRISAWCVPRQRRSPRCMAGVHRRSGAHEHFPGAPGLLRSGAGVPETSLPRTTSAGRRVTKEPASSPDFAASSTT